MKNIDLRNKRRFLLKASFIITLMLIVFACTSKKDQAKLDIDKMLDYCVAKTKATKATLTEADSLPRNIYSNQIQWNKVGIHDWCSGFWPGVLWYAYEASGDTSLFAGAQIFTAPLKGVLDVPVDNHDLGFMLYCSMGNGYRLSKSDDYKNFLLLTADSLATLYNPKVGTILSWPVMREKMNWPHNTIIDNMINLELLFWASKNGGDQSLYNMAVKHAETCMNTLIRPDYTTYHVAVFDTTNGHFIKGVTHQGYADDSQWARGQGWSIYGYSMVYRETKDQKFLDTAIKLADKFIEMIPEDTIPYWDYNDPAIPNAPKDASAAAIIASGLLELQSFVSDEQVKAKYAKTAIDLLTALSSDKYLSKAKNQSFLMHSTGHWPAKSEIDASIIYADYYYIEALLRAKQYLN
ncbi:glycoside hydrolase family 88 protein [Saccharicrinis fermentans]|uniref:Unsaturated glucuronyl hydrolase n=1 Tax=Saccharicrinis fermentans DSM 9555 = JCM 21142 TaxID=869213 RepID=W7Y2P0_9BACT|nr:glycoside hydrolase family 88 protein [Saccharicrinis fermentans]GAF05075.1 unsaturated glucuronyl hydrolase [Saccharicrinis fermentans DSM 9555 = JCM 21142]